ncbi:MAG: tetratricopeptide (TPR) repeat protein [Alphaproteobacteria bacterium]
MESLDRKDKIGENLRWLLRLYWYQGQAERAEYYANEAISECKSIDASSDLAMAYSLRSQLDMLNDRTAEAVEWGNKALPLEKKFPNPAVRVHALNNVGTALLLHGNESGEDLLNESLSLGEEHGLHEDVARVYTNYSDYCVRFKKLELAEKLITKRIQYDV